MIRTKTGAAGVSIASNSLLIVLKVTSGIDLVASVIAFASVSKADEPADAEHPYGHQKLENLAAAIEGMLILVGAAVIVYESIHRLVKGAHVDSLGFGIAVVGVSALVNFGVS